MAEKYGMPGKTDNEGFDPYADTVGPGFRSIYGGIVKRDESGQIVIGRPLMGYYQNHNPRPGPVYAGGGYTPINEALLACDGLQELLDKFPDLANDVSTGGATPLHMCGMGQKTQKRSPSRPQSGRANVQVPGRKTQKRSPSRPQSGRANVQVPGRKTQKRRDKDQDRLQKEWRACPLKELLPSEVCKEVRSIAFPDGGVVIEMLPVWGSSKYLPAHNGGQKYVKTAEQLRELLAGRLSGGFPLPVHIVDEPIQGRLGIYDQFSDWERAWDLVASNRSYSMAPTSRLGAFEVHLIHNWNPLLCTGKLEGNQTHSADSGPPVSGSYGILCSACAQRAEGLEMEISPPSSRGMQLQHTLLHSKLWTRRWPDFWSLLSRIGTLVIQEAPDVPRPVALTAVSFAKRSCATLRQCEFASRQMTINSVSSATFSEKQSAIQQELTELFSRSSSGGKWTVVGERSKKVVSDALKAHGVESACTVTLLWGLDGKPYKSDLDLMTTVDGMRLYWNRLEVGKCSLDFDWNARDTEVRPDPKENISLGQAEVYDEVWPTGRSRDEPMQICTVIVSEEDLQMKEIQRASSNFTLSVCESESLELYTITSLLQQHGFSAEAFERFALASRDEWHGTELPLFIGKFVQEQERLQREELALQQFLELRESCITQQNQIRQDYANEFEQGQEEAGKIYVQLCLCLIRKVPEHHLELSLLENGEASPQEAHEKLLAAVHLNERRKGLLSAWYSEVNSWRGESEQEIEVFDAILQQRPDIARMLSFSQESEVQTLDDEIQSFHARIQEATEKYDRQSLYQECIDELTERFNVQWADCLQSLGF
eukprot:Skav208103  [mRNA]  locus=scaffold1681:270079:277632:- [translate_table: standard]